MPISGYPSGLTNLIKTGWVRAFPALDIHFSDATALHLSSAPFTVSGTVYSEALDQVKTIKSSRGRSIDRAELTINNADLVIGDILLSDDIDDILENLPATLHTIFVNVRNPAEYYKITKMSGIVHTFTEDGSTDLNLTIISDAYAGRGVAPYDVKESCVWRYKDGINCTYDGDLATCDLTLTGANGCVAHFGMEDAKANYGGGAVHLKEATRLTFNPYGVGGEGGDSGCFFGLTPIYTGDSFETAPIKSFEKGDAVLSFETGNFESADDSAAMDVIRHTNRNWYHLMFSDGAELDVTGTHPFFPEPNKRTLVKDFQLGMQFRRLLPSGWRTVKLIEMTPMSSMVPVDFYNVPVAVNHDYFANGFPVSNMKNRDGFELPY